MKTRQDLARLRELLDAVIRGLEGHPFRWGDGKRANWMRRLQAAGVELVTQTGIDKRGHRLKRGANPVGTVYFGAPIQRDADVFVLGVQTEPVRPERPAEPLFDRPRPARGKAARS